MATVAEIIRAKQSEIIEEWRDEAAKAASARGLDRPELVNLFPRYLTSLATTKPADLGDFAGRRRKLVEDHLATRLRQGFEIGEIVDEFAILARVIARTCDALPASKRPASSDIQRYFSEIAAASTAASDIFRKHLLEDEQTEKRYLRLLQKIASDALVPDSKPFRQRLADVLSLFLEAMSAQSAALLLVDVETSRLVTTTAVGTGTAALEAYATALDPSTFPGLSAASLDGPLADDVDATALPISPELRKAGVSSLIGVRLPPRRRLLGILYVGLTDERPFSAAEIRRIETLGAHLTIHLDNARLYADLQQKVALLSGEREIRERFVSVLAHDLRTPLSTAKLWASLMIKSPDSAKRQESALKVERNLARIETMINDLLDANHIRGGERLPLRIAECDLGLLVREVLTELTALHGDRFDLDAPDRLLGYWSAPEMRRTIENLAMNAVKYGAPKAPIRVVVRTRGERVKLSVQNSGRPIPKAELKKLFVSAFRAPSAVAGPSKGWGLGLTLVKGCAEAHGGTVTATSDEKRGTIFTIHLPLDARPFQTFQKDTVSKGR